jgi:hypothetical protein
VQRQRLLTTLQLRQAKHDSNLPYKLFATAKVLRDVRARIVLSAEEEKRSLAMTLKRTRRLIACLAQTRNESAFAQDRPIPPRLVRWHAQICAAPGVHKPLGSSSSAASLQSALIHTTEAILDVVFVPFVPQPASPSAIYWLHVGQLHALAAFVRSTHPRLFRAVRDLPIVPCFTFARKRTGPRLCPAYRRIRSRWLSKLHCSASSP